MDRWYEVSVSGRLLKQRTSMYSPGWVVGGRSELRDMTLIEIQSVVMLWRSGDAVHRMEDGFEAAGMPNPTCVRGGVFF